MRRKEDQAQTHTHPQSILRNLWTSASLEAGDPQAKSRNSPVQGHTRLLLISEFFQVTCDNVSYIHTERDLDPVEVPVVGHTHSGSVRPVLPAEDWHLRRFVVGRRRYSVNVAVLPGVLMRYFHIDHAVCESIFLAKIVAWCDTVCLVFFLVGAQEHLHRCIICDHGMIFAE